MKFEDKIDASETVCVCVCVCVKMHLTLRLPD